MPQRRSKPLAWRGDGVADTPDASNTPNGMMQSLQNLIPHPATTKLWQCRPAAIQQIDFTTAGSAFSSGFSTGFGPTPFTPPVGNISLLKIVGTFAFGMIATGTFPGRDQPFMINLLTNSIVAITGYT